jgi:translation initiation factor 1 (eIF-1/SUI1)
VRHAPPRRPHAPPPPPDRNPRRPLPSPPPPQKKHSPDRTPTTNQQTKTDPFSSAAAEEAKNDRDGGAADEHVHIRVQQRNGKKSLTTVQGLKKAYDYKKVLKALKKGEWLGVGGGGWVGGDEGRASRRSRRPAPAAASRLSPPRDAPPSLFPPPPPPPFALPQRPLSHTHTTPSTPPNHKTEFCCNGTVVDDPDLGQVIQLQGDQRKNVVDFLTQEGLVKKDLIKVHGF